jgi:hypothetical protein
MNDARTHARTHDTRTKARVRSPGARLQAASAAEKEEEKEVKKEGEGEADAGAEIDPATQRSDLLSLLLKSRAEDARHNLTDEEIFSDSFIFLLAGMPVNQRKVLLSSLLALTRVLRVVSCRVCRVVLLCCLVGHEVRYSELIIIIIIIIIFFCCYYYFVG